MKRVLVVAAMAGTASVAIIASAVGHASDVPAISSTVTALGGNITLAPPQTGYQPQVSSDEASEIASQQFEGATGISESPVLALLTWSAHPVDENDQPIGPPHYSDVPVWVVSVQGVCSQVVPDTGKCLSSVTVALVDASKGAFLIGFPETELASTAR